MWCLHATIALVSFLPLPPGTQQRAHTPSAVRRATLPRALGAGQLPASPKEVATEISVAVGAALQDGRRRLCIVTPDELAFGMFGKPMGKQVLGNPDVKAPASLLARNERELAYLVVEMFQQYAESCVVVLSDSKWVKAAEKDWKNASIRPGRIVGSIKELLKPAGFGQKTKAGKPKVVIVSQPGTAALGELEPYAEELGSAAVVVLLNPRKEPEGYFTAFTLQDNPHPDWAGGLLFQAHPGLWVLGAAGNSGAVKVHGTSNRRPTLDEIDAGFGKVSGDTNWFSGGGAAAALRRRSGAPSEEAATLS